MYVTCMYNIINNMYKHVLIGADMTIFIYCMYMYMYMYMYKKVLSIQFTCMYHVYANRMQA